MLDIVKTASKERLLLQENKLKQIVSVLEIIETAMRPVPQTFYLIPMCRKFRDKNVGLTLGHLKEHRGNGMFSEIKLIAENKKKNTNKNLCNGMCPLENLC